MIGTGSGNWVAHTSKKIEDTIQLPLLCPSRLLLGVDPEAFCHRQVPRTLIHLAVCPGWRIDTSWGSTHSSHRSHRKTCDEHARRPAQDLEHGTCLFLESASSFPCFAFIVYLRCKLCSKCLRAPVGSASDSFGSSTGSRWSNPKSACSKRLTQPHGRGAR